MARPICLRLLAHLVRAAASRTFWTAGSRRPMRMAMIAITTNSSISVKPRRERVDIELSHSETHRSYLGTSLVQRIGRPTDGRGVGPDWTAELSREGTGSRG